MYTSSILWMLSWPVLIYISLLLVMYAVKKYEAKPKSEA
jgi:hypothetical protein